MRARTANAEGGDLMQSGPMGLSSAMTTPINTLSSRRAPMMMPPKVLAQSRYDASQGKVQVVAGDNLCLPIGEKGLQFSYGRLQSIGHIVINLRETEVSLTL